MIRNGQRISTARAVGWPFGGGGVWVPMAVGGGLEGGTSAGDSSGVGPGKRRKVAPSSGGLTMLRLTCAAMTARH
jgi:hypothetical protein